MIFVFVVAPRKKFVTFFGGEYREKKFVTFEKANSFKRGECVLGWLDLLR